VEIAVHTDDPGKRRSEELPVAQHRFASALDVIASDAHRSVHLGTELAAEVRERVRQLWHFRRLAAGLVQEGFDESVPGGSGCEHQMPRLDVGVGWRADGQFECLVDDLAGHGTVGQEHPNGPTRIDGLLEIEHGRSSGR
jgi:hypothetical protein